ncbi:MAG: phytanoyl-CoA dioxygenase family protein [Alphaproteobacteria bacterium]|nr:phytanoyl-CoA dioxygenase family protein [Alphaproteobacteria bacterium]
MASLDAHELDENPFSPESQAAANTKRLSSEADRAAVAGSSAKLRRDGYVILERLIESPRIDAIRAEAHRLLANVPRGTTNFGGFSTQRLSNLVARTRMLDDLYLHPQLLAIAEAHLEDQIQLSIANFINIEPGEEAQPFHRDDSLYRLPRPHIPLSVNTMWAIDDFTPENGSTLLIPGSHLLAPREVPSTGDVMTAAMPAGSVLIYDGSLFHAGGANTSQTCRLGTSVIYNRAWLRQQENQFLGVPPEIAKTLPRDMQKLIGYWVANNFLGYLNDQSPARLLD